MAQVEVYIEETLCKKVTYNVPDNASVTDRMAVAEDLARRAYSAEVIVLTADDFNGQAQIMSKDLESGTESGWTAL